MIPLYGFLEADTIGLLVFAYPEETIEDLINKLQNSAAVRIKPRTAMKLFYKSKMMTSNLTVLDAGFQPLDHFFVVHGKKMHV